MDIAIGVFAFLILLAVFFATGKKTPPRSLDALPPPSEAVRRLALAGKSIEAIKRYRQDTGATLREAKLLVDALRR